jgi:hypothetical protein
MSSFQDTPSGTAAPTSAVQLATAPAIEPTLLSPTTTAPNSELNRLTEQISMHLRLKRGSDAETEDFCTIHPEDVVTSSELVAVIEEEVIFSIEGREKVVQVDVKWLSGAPTAMMMTSFTIMTPEKGRSWNDFLQGLQDHYDKTGAFVEVNLEATILVLEELSTPITEHQ